MADTHDTIDGLLAEFRGYSAGMPASYHVTMSWADFRKMLDRFDAAHRREVATTKQSLAVGNSGDCAKLHEALKPVKRYLDGYTVNILELRRTVDAALTAPTRNCDRFASAEEAWDAYDAWVESYREKGETEPLNEFGWLFTLATEKEGGAK